MKLLSSADDCDAKSVPVEKIVSFIIQVHLRPKTTHQWFIYSPQAILALIFHMSSDAALL